jgi:hypothetical protein
MADQPVKKCSNCKEEWQEGHKCDGALEVKASEPIKVKAIGPDGKE